MILVDHTKPEYLEQLQNVTHVNGTARVQTVDHTWNKEFAELIAAFQREQGDIAFRPGQAPVGKTLGDMIGQRARRHRHHARTFPARQLHRQVPDPACRASSSAATKLEAIAERRSGPS